MRNGRRFGLTAVAVLSAAAASAGVSGRVIDGQGRPVAGALVEAYAQEPSDARSARIVALRPRTPLAGAPTAADGAFDLRLGDAVVDLVATADGFSPSFTTPDPGAPITLTLRRAAQQRGVVVANGKPVPDAAVVWLAGGFEQGSGELVVRTGRDGSYEVPDPEAWTTAAVLHPEFAPLEIVSPGDVWGGSPRRHELSAGLTVEGTVLDDRSGRPVAGATVWLGGWPVGQSNSRGGFRLLHAPASWTSLTARTETLVGAARRSAGTVVVHMRPARVLSGLVRDGKSGAPLAGATVTLIGERPLSTAISGAAGRYTFSVEAGRYSLAVTRPGYAPASAELVDLRRSAAATRDVALTKLRQVRGRVVGEDRKGIEGALVGLGLKGTPTVYRRGSFAGAGEWTLSSADGGFAIPVMEPPLPDVETLDQPLIAIKEGYAAGRLETVRLPKAGEPPLAIVLSRGVELKGRVHTADGAPVPGVAVTVAEEPTAGASPWLMPLFGAGVEGGGWIESDAAGAFSLRVQPRLHQLWLRKSGLAPKLVRDYDPSSGALEVVLDPAAELRGRVMRSDGSGIAGVRLMAQRQTGLTPAPAISEADGSFVIGDLAPGPHMLHVMNLEPYIAETRNVDAPASDLRIQLGPTGVVRGRVSDARSRRPVPLFDVSLELQAGPDGERPAESSGKMAMAVGVDGGFTIPEAPAGEVAVSVRAEGYVLKRVEGLVVASGDPLDLEIALDPGVSLRGRASSRDGEAVADTQVVASAEGESLGNAATDEKGEFEMAGIRAGSLKLEFHHDGFVTERRTVNAADGVRVDVVLSRGLALKGSVVSNGVGVPNAGVEASSSAAEAESRSTVTDSAGRFTLAGLVPGRYLVSASAEDKGTASLADVDAETAGPLRLVLERAPTAVLSGMVSGLPPGDDVLMRLVMVEGEDGGSEQAPIEASGAFRVERAPAGRVKARAVVRMQSGAMRSSRSHELTLAPGTESQLLIELHSDVVISGDVRRDGGPLPHVAVSFQPSDNGDAVSMVRAGSDGHYEVAGVEPGRYRVNVADTGLSFQTDYVVTGSAVFDIDVTGASLRGRVVDAAGGAPLAGVALSLLSGKDDSEAASVTSNARGEFVTQTLAEGHYRLLTSKAGFGQQVRELDLLRGGPELVLELSAADGVGLSVVDARNGRPLEAIVVVRDLAKRMVANRHSDVAADGSVTIALADGPYLLSTSANGYGTATLRITSPAPGLRVGLTPGGTLVVESERELRGRIRLLQPDGEEYVRCWCNGIADIQLKGRHTSIPNITPGRYTIELLDDDDSASPAGDVAIEEGQTATVRIN